MTSDGISTADWDHVHELALNVVHCSDDPALWSEARRSLRVYLEELRGRYGEKASLSATEADYADSPQEAERLFLRAFDLALQASDVGNLKEVSLSLANLYVTELDQLSDARSWLDVARQWVNPQISGDWGEYTSIAEAIAAASAESESE